jgi:hypothetical protein
MTTTLQAGRIEDNSLDVLFREARTHTAWQPQLVPEGLLREVYDLARMGPTSFDGSPARFFFLTSEAAKERLIRPSYPATWTRSGRHPLPSSSPRTWSSTSICRSCPRRSAPENGSSAIPA